MKSTAGIVKDNMLLGTYIVLHKSICCQKTVCWEPPIQDLEVSEELVFQSSKMVAKMTWKTGVEVDDL